MDGLDGLEERPEEEALARPFVVLEDGTAEFHYDLWKFRTPLGVLIQCIVVSRLADGRFLAASPYSAWHRQTSKRSLPAVLSKPLLVEVVIAHVSAREAALEEYMKVWVGYITAETFEEMEPYLDGMQIDQPFKVPAGSDYLPYAPALIEALDERFAFLSAESGLGDMSVVREEGQEYGLGEGSDIPTRVASLESLMDKMNGNLETVLEKLGHLPNRKAAPAPGRVSFAAALIEVPARSTRLDPLAKKFPGLDAAVVSAALAAGVPEENLTEMQRLIGAGGRATLRLREPALRASAKKEAKKTAEHLDESEDEVEPDLVLDEPGSALAGGPATVEGALAKLTELVAILSDDKLKRAKSTKMDLALDSIANSSGVGESSSGSTGKRAAAARRALRVGLQESPEEISAVVEKLLLEDLVLKTQAPGMPANDFNARAWVEHRSRIGAYKTSAYMAWAAAGVLDDLVKGRVSHARARAGLMLVMLDQVAIDRGSWVPGAELMLEQGPPLSALASHTLPSVADGESPFSRILDSRWAEVMLSHLRDAEDYLQKRRTLGKKLNDDGEKDKEKEAGRQQKPKAKAKGKSSAETAADA